MWIITRHIETSEHCLSTCLCKLFYIYVFYKKICVARCHQSIHNQRALETLLYTTLLRSPLYAWLKGIWIISQICSFSRGEEWSVVAMPLLHVAWPFNSCWPQSFSGTGPDGFLFLKNIKKSINWVIPTKFSHLFSRLINCSSTNYFSKAQAHWIHCIICCGKQPISGFTAKWGIWNWWPKLTVCWGGKAISRIERPKVYYFCKSQSSVHHQMLYTPYRAQDCWDLKPSVPKTGRVSWEIESAFFFRKSSGNKQYDMSISLAISMWKP